MFKNLNTKVSGFSNNLTKIFTGQGKGVLHKVKASFLAIAIGLLIGMIPILASGGNPFSAYGELLTSGFNEFKVDTFFSNSAIFIILAIGIGISFKTGLFNIGAAGQFILAGAVTVVMGIKIHDMNKSISIPVLMLVSMLIGALAASLAGVLKAFFNVHEVVSTILLNWVFFFIVKYIFSSPEYMAPTGNGSQTVHDNMRLFFSPTTKDTWIIFSVAIILGIMTWALFKFTTFGYSLKVNGMNNDAAKYSGINIKMTTIASMMLSGAFCGLAGFIFYSCSMGNMPLLNDDILPTMPFEAIAITLLAFSSPLGAIPAGMFYAMISTSSGDASLAGHVTAETIGIVLAIIVMFAALAPLFENARWGKRIYEELICLFDPTQKEERNKYKNKVSNYKQENHSELLKLKSEALEERKKRKQLQNEWASYLRKAEDDTVIAEMNEKHRAEINALKKLNKYEGMKNIYYADLQKFRADFKEQKTNFLEQRKQVVEGGK
ncbi:ABC transporter permease [Mycoplasma todarodis]|uniref:ABC transporter permease n=1 Tax=Mycoplasma todarodis TaxID=1937191 RepID=A0A4R0XLD3_9MOLU|nr:ABC transporter permease [Mycoplasma todarodis]TCG11463.1 hypothetical protein C4B25_01605 [Mycoplasma todarodis]